MNYIAKYESCFMSVLILVKDCTAYRLIGISQQISFPLTLCDYGIIIIHKIIFSLINCVQLIVVMCVFSCIVFRAENNFCLTEYFLYSIKFPIDSYMVEDCAAIGTEAPVFSDNVNNLKMCDNTTVAALLCTEYCFLAWQSRFPLE